MVVNELNTYLDQHRVRENTYSRPSVVVNELNTYLDQHRVRENTYSRPSVVVNELNTYLDQHRVRENTYSRTNQPTVVTTPTGTCDPMDPVPMVTSALRVSRLGLGTL